MNSLYTILRKHTDPDRREIHLNDFGLDIESDFTSEPYPCRELRCECGSVLLTVLDAPFPYTFGFKKGLPLAFAYSDVTYYEDGRVLDLFRRCDIADTSHFVLSCDSCRREDTIQKSRDGGLLFVRSMPEVHKPIPRRRSLLFELPTCPQ